MYFLKAKKAVNVQSYYSK